MGEGQRSRAVEGIYVVWLEKRNLSPLVGGFEEEIASDSFRRYLSSERLFRTRLIETLPGLR